MRTAANSRVGNGPQMSAILVHHAGDKSVEGSGSGRGGLLVIWHRWLDIFLYLLVHVRPPEFERRRCLHLVKPAWSLFSSLIARGQGLAGRMMRFPRSSITWPAMQGSPATVFFRMMATRVVHWRSDTFGFLPAPSFLMMLSEFLQSTLLEVLVVLQDSGNIYLHRLL